MNIYYGSQSGNSQEIAKILLNRIIEECKVDDSNNGVSFNTLNSLTEIVMTDENINNIKYLLIVTSTYGNGDPPENASKLWRLLKKRTIYKEMFKEIKFAVLALGNSNYDKFCNFGKNINKRLEELGGKKIMELVCVDEISDMEEQVDNWCDNIIKIIKKEK